MRVLKPYNFIFALLTGALLLSACIKNDNEDNQPISALTVVNAFSGVSSIDFYLDHNQVNAAPWNYKLSSGYFNIYPGNRNVKVVNGVNSAQILARSDYNFPTGKYISLFIAQKTETNADSAVLVVTVDSLAQTATGKASIRFVNLTPGSRKIDVSIKDAPNALFSDLAFKTASDFVTIDPSSTFTLEIREAGSDGAPKLEVTPFTVQAGKIYTVFLSGLWDGTGASALSAKAVINY